MDPSRLSHCYCRSATSPTQRWKWPCGLVAMRMAHGAYRASDTAACRAQTGSSRFTSDESPSRKADISAQMMSDEPCSACG